MIFFIKHIFFLILALNSAHAQNKNFTDFLEPNTLKSLENFELKVDKLSDKNCSQLRSSLDFIHKFNPEYFKLKKNDSSLHAVMTTAFDIKNKLREYITPSTSLTCVNSIRESLVLLRYFEDFFLLTTIEPKPFDKENDKRIAPTLIDSNLSYLQTNQKNIKLKSGDILLSRGNAYTSAAIARIGETPAQFSHISQVYIDAPIGTEISIEQAINDPRVFTVESHIEVGAFTRNFKEYVEDGNARVLLYRYRGKEREANYSARYIYDYVKIYQKKHMEKYGNGTYSVNNNPPYDFGMDISNKNELFCSEVPLVGYASRGINIPTFLTRLKVNNLTQIMDINVSHTFAPADIEVEPQFEFLAEWRDLRKTASLVKKEIALTSIFDWMKKYGYEFHYNAIDYIKAEIALSLRVLDLGFTDKLPKNMSKKMIRMTFALDRVGESLERQLDAYEKQQFASGRKYRPTYEEQLKLLEKFRKLDSDKGLSGGFHKTFRP